MPDPHHNEPPDQQPGHHPEHEQDKPDLDAFAERFGARPAEDDSEEPGPREGAGGGTSPLDTVWSVAAGARDLAEPVARFVQTSVGRVVHTIEDRRTLVDRVDRLEAQVEALGARLDEMSRTGG